ncbi:hypothetical protein AB1Y20_003148 [Prymnesium parvum]|uniref:Glycosyltransferase 61 catalytic domain-containing protein n=1 Tax=Prymnesium parvum TaxID=97485 RepID=A0AB34JB80_PRYPA
MHRACSIAALNGAHGRGLSPLDHSHLPFSLHALWHKLADGSALLKANATRKIDRSVVSRLAHRLRRRQPPTMSLSWHALRHLTQRHTCSYLEHQLPHLRFLLAHDVADSVLRQHLRSSTEFLLAHLAGGTTLLAKSGIVVTTNANATAILDLSEGCCRPGPASCWNTSTSAARQQPWIKCAAQPPHSFAEHMIGTILTRPLVRRYEWIYLATHSHDASYFHAVSETFPRLLWGLDLLCSHPQIRISVNGALNLKLLEVVGLSHRAVMVGEQEILAGGAVTIPPPATFARSPIAVALSSRAVRLLEGCAMRASPTPQKRKPYILVIRRDPDAHGARAILNHKQLLGHLHAVFPAFDVREFTPEPQPFVDVINLWRGAVLVVGPHGAGMTNAFFVNPQAWVVEVIREGQTGRVYQDITRRSGARFVECAYKYDTTKTGTSNFLLDIPWFFNCLWLKNVSLPNANTQTWQKLRERHTKTHA